MHREGGGRRGGRCTERVEGGEEGGAQRGWREGRRYMQRETGEGANEKERKYRHAKYRVKDMKTREGWREVVKEERKK